MSTLTPTAADQLNAALKTNATTLEAYTKNTRDARDECRDMIDKTEAALDSLIAKGTLPARGAGAGGPSAANLFAQSEQFAAFKAGAVSTGLVTLDTGVAGLRAAATLTSDGGSPYGVPAQHDPRFGNMPARKLQLLDVLPVIPVESAGTFQFNQLSGYVNAAAVQATQGSAKAQATVPPILVTANIATIAHYIQASMQVLQDASQLSNQLSGLLSYCVRQKLEAQIIGGTGGTGDILGLIPQSTAFVSTFASAADKIGDAMTSLDNTGWSANVIVMNPTDAFAIRSSKSSGSGEYLIAAPGMAVAPTLYGVPVATSPFVPAGTAIVMDAGQVALLDRMQVAVVASREHGTNLTQNLVTILAELRAGLAVFSPSALLKVDLTVV